MNTVSPPPKAGRREWIGLGVIALPCLLYSMDLTVLNLAVPSLSADLKPSSTQLLWIIGAAPPERAGAASAISETCSEFGGALGIAILGSIGTAIYRRAMAGSVVDGIPHEAAVAARDTLGGAVAVAGQLPGPGAALLDTARRAFAEGLQVTALTSAFVVLGMAIFVLVSLRHVRSASQPADPDRGPERAIADTAST